MAIRPRQLDETNFATTPALSINVLDYTPGGNRDFTGAGWTHIGNGEAQDATGSFVLPADMTLDFVVSLDAFHLTASGTSRASFRLNFDSGATIVGGGQAESLTINNDPNAKHHAVTFVIPGVSLSAGAHTVDFEGSVAVAPSTTWRLDVNSWIKITARSVSGSGLGGTLVEEDISQDVTVFNITDASETTLSTKTIDVGQNEDLLVMFTGWIVEQTAAQSFTAQVRLRVGGTLYRYVQCRCDDQFSQTNISFAWIVPDLGTGSYAVEVTARAGTGETGEVRNAGLTTALIRGGQDELRDKDGNVISSIRRYRQYGGNTRVSAQPDGGDLIEFDAIADGLSDPEVVSLSTDRTIVATAPAAIPTEPLSITFDGNEGEVVACSFAAQGVTSSSPDTAIFRMRLDGTLVGNIVSHVFAGSLWQQGFTDTLFVKLTASGPHTLDLYAWTVGGESFDVVAGTELRLQKWRGGYVQPENVPVLDGNSFSGDTFDYVAAPGASNEARMLFNDGLRYKLTLPYSMDLDTTGLGGVESSYTLADGPQYFYAVKDTGNTAGIIASDQPLSSGPADYSEWKYLGSAPRDSGALLPVSQAGSKFTLDAWKAFDTNSGSIGPDGSPVSMNSGLSALVPESASHADVGIKIDTDLTAGDRWVARLRTKSSGGEFSQAVMISGSASGQSTVVHAPDCPLLTAQTLWRELVRSSGTGNLSFYAYLLSGWIDAGLSGEAQTQAQYLPDTKLPWGAWQTGGTQVIFDKPAGEPSSTLRLTLQDGKQRTLSLPVTWDHTNSVANLGYDAVADETGDGFLNFFIAPDSGNDDLLTVVASKNDNATGPTNKSVWRKAWAARRVSAVFDWTVQIGQDLFTIDQRERESVATSSVFSATAKSLAGYIPTGSVAADIRFRIDQSTSDTGVETWAMRFGPDNTHQPEILVVSGGGVSGLVFNGEREALVPVASNLDVYLELQDQGGTKTTADNYFWWVSGWKDGDLS